MTSHQNTPKMLGVGEWLIAYKDTAYTVMALELFLAAMVFGLLYFRVKEFRGSSITFMISQVMLASFYYTLMSLGSDGFGLWLGHLLFQFGTAGTVIRTLQMSQEIRALDAGDGCRGNRDVSTVATGAVSMIWAVFWLIYFSVATITPTQTWMAGAGWAVLQAGAFGIFGYTAHKSIVLSRPQGLLAKLATIVVMLSLICAGIYGTVTTFSLAWKEGDGPKEYVMFKLLWFIGLQIGVTLLPLFMLMHIACKPPGVRDFHTQDSQNQGTNPRALLPPQETDAYGQLNNSESQQRQQL